MNTPLEAIAQEIAMPEPPTMPEPPKPADFETADAMLEHIKAKCAELEGWAHDTLAKVTEHTHAEPLGRLVGTLASTIKGLEAMQENRGVLFALEQPLLKRLEDFEARLLASVTAQIEAQSVAAHSFLQREFDEREAALAPRESVLNEKEAELHGRRLLVEEQLSQLNQALRSIELDAKEAALKTKADSVGVLLDTPDPIAAPDLPPPEQQTQTVTTTGATGHFGPSLEPELPSPSKAPPSLSGADGPPTLNDPPTLTDNAKPEEPELEGITESPQKIMRDHNARIGAQEPADTEPPPAGAPPDELPEPAVAAPVELPPAPKLIPHWMPGQG